MTYGKGQAGHTFGRRGGNRWDVSAANKARLPQGIKCISCGSVKAIRFFSDSQQKKLLDHIQQYQHRTRKEFNAKLAAYVDCSACAPRVGTELKCNDCKLYKALDAFTATQRRNGDDANCQDCMDKIIATEATDPDSYHDDDAGSDDDDDDSDDSDAEFHTSAAGTTSGMSTLSITNDSSTVRASSASGGVSLDDRSEHDYVPSQASTSVASTSMRSRDGNQDTNTHRNWAKVPALKPYMSRGYVFEQQRRRERDVADRAKAVENGAVPACLENVTVESDEEDSDDDADE